MDQELQNERMKIRKSKTKAQKEGTKSKIMLTKL